MQNALKKLFTNELFFCEAALCGGIANFLLPLVHMLDGASGAVDFSYCAKCLLEGVCLLGLYISYCRHSKNVMKGLMGALLAVNLMLAIDLVSLMQSLTLDCVIEALFLVLSVVLLVNHFVISSSRRSSPKNVYVNQIACCLLMLFPGFIWGIAGIVFDSSVTSVLTQIVEILAFSGMVAAIVCVESRLDAYRLDREAAGWTEEDGYPEGYVHECDKN